MHVERKTVNTNVSITGIGLHSGIYTKVELHPMRAGNGITFVRADLDGLRIPALQASTTSLDYATTVGKADVAVGTVEHLLAAVMAFGITDLDVHIDGPEVPIVDGSALPFMHLIDAAGIRGLGVDLPVLRVTEPIEIVDGEKSIRITPSNRLVLNYKIDFSHPAIGRQSYRFDYHRDNFLRKIAPARTYGFLRDVEKMRAAGLARGGSVENALVLDDRGVMNGPPRFRDEFVRHKILDLLGDLALLGRPIVGEITANRAGHAMHSRFVGEILRKTVAAIDESEGTQPAEAIESFA